MIKLMIADDSIMFRQGLKILLEQERDMNVLAEATDSHECIELLSDKMIDILILNLSMEHGYDLLEQLNYKHKKKIRILVLVEEKDFVGIVRAMEIGADGYISQKYSINQLKEAIYCMMRGELYLPSKLISSYYQYQDAITRDFNRKNSLTKRESEILKHLAFGMYNKEIANKLGISERTVKNHVFSIFKKLGCTDRTQAAVFAIRSQMVDLYQ